MSRTGTASSALLAEINVNQDIAEDDVLKGSFLKNADKRVDRDRTWCERTFSSLKEGSMRSSIFSLTSCAVGGGILSLPYAFCLSGWALGILAIVTSALANIWSNKILMKVVIAKKLRNFDEIALYAGGPCMGKFVEIIILSYFCLMFHTNQCFHTF